MRPLRLALATTLTLSALTATNALAESWCATPIVVHEWGVHLFSADGQVVVDDAWIPDFFDRTPVAETPMPVTSGPSDGGERALPVLHFYVPQPWSASTPLAIDVSFTQGMPTVWFPEASQPSPNQLRWSDLDLDATPPATELPDGGEWVTQARELGASWINTAQTTERFVFYEGETTESPLVRIERGETWAEDNAHYVIHNDSAYPVHDVMVIRREGDTRQVFTAPTIPAGRSAGFLLEGALDDAAFEDATRGYLASAMGGASPLDGRDFFHPCVMMRDPSEPFTESSDHRLFDAEWAIVDGVWGERLFDQEGTVVLYREDVSYVDAKVPMSLYSDMFHYVELSRASLVLWEGLDL